MCRISGSVVLYTTAITEVRLMKMPAIYEQAIKAGENFLDGIEARLKAARIEINGLDEFLQTFILEVYPLLLDWPLFLRLLPDLKNTKSIGHDEALNVIFEGGYYRDFIAAWGSEKATEIIGQGFRNIAPAKKQPRDYEIDPRHLEVMEILSKRIPCHLDLVLVIEMLGREKGNRSEKEIYYFWHWMHSSIDGCPDFAKIRDYWYLLSYRHQLRSRIIEEIEKKINQATGVLATGGRLAISKTNRQEMIVSGFQTILRDIGSYEALSRVIESCNSDIWPDDITANFWSTLLFLRNNVIRECGHSPFEVRQEVITVYDRIGLAGAVEELRKCLKCFPHVVTAARYLSWGIVPEEISGFSHNETTYGNNWDRAQLLNYWFNHYLPIINDMVKSGYLRKLASKTVTIEPEKFILSRTIYLENSDVVTFIANGKPGRIWFERKLADPLQEKRGHHGSMDYVRLIKEILEGNWSRITYGHQSEIVAPIARIEPPFSETEISCMRTTVSRIHEVGVMQLVCNINGLSLDEKEILVSKLLERINASG